MLRERRPNSYHNLIEHLATTSTYFVAGPSRAGESDLNYYTKHPLGVVRGFARTCQDVLGYVTAKLKHRVGTPPVGGCRKEIDVLREVPTS